MAAYGSVTNQEHTMLLEYAAQLCHKRKQSQF